MSSASRGNTAGAAGFERSFFESLTHRIQPSSTYETKLLETILAVLSLAALFLPAITHAQVPGAPPPAAPAAPLLTPDQLQDLVGRVALYPDDLLALVLPASTTPLDIVKAQRFLAKAD